MKVREVFEYEVYDNVEGKDLDNLDNVFKIEDYVDCVDDMCCPFWDGYIKPEIYNHTIEILEK